MDKQGLIQEIIPYVKKIIISERDKVEADIIAWLKQKGFWFGIIGTKFIPILWDLLTGPLLPFIITTVFNVICGTSAPYLKPFLPLIDQGIKYINDKYLGEMERARLLDILHIIVNNNQQLPVMLLEEKMEILASQEYFSSI